MAMAVARPIPLAAPVMKHFFPEKSFIFMYASLGIMTDWIIKVFYLVILVFQLIICRPEKCFHEESVVVFHGKLILT